MTVITHSRRKSSLSKMIDATGGVSVGVALTQARANLETLRPQCLAELAGRIDELAATTAPAPDWDETAALGRIYRLANDIIDVAGPFEQRDVCAAAAGLCDLIDAVTPERPFDWRVTPVIAQSLRLFLVLLDQAQRDEVRANLDRLIDRKLGRAA